MLAAQSPPNNRQAEEALLGAVLVNPEVYADVSSLLHPDDFFIVRNGWIWQAFHQLSERGGAIDILTTADELTRVGKLGEAGGPAYLTSLAGSVPFTHHAEYYSAAIKDAAILHRWAEEARAEDDRKAGNGKSREVIGVNPHTGEPLYAS